jgi:hypothetical protein
MDIQHNEHVKARNYDLDIRAAQEGLPVYPSLGATVAKFRKRAADICIVHRAVARREHGLAVLEAIRKLNDQALKRELPEHKIDCASGTTHNDGLAILKALRVQHCNHCNPDTIRAKRSIESLQKQYDAIMVRNRAGIPVS